MKGGKIPLTLPVRGTGQKHDRKRLIKDGISGKKRANNLHTSSFHVVEYSFHALEYSFYDVKWSFRDVKRRNETVIPFSSSGIGEKGKRKQIVIGRNDYASGSSLPERR